LELFDGGSLALQPVIFSIGILKFASIIPIIQKLVSEFEKYA
jgi:hypothetical protein